MWFISKKIHNKMMKAKENDIQELTNKVEKLEIFLEEEKENNKYLKEKYDFLNEKYLYESRNNAKLLKENTKLEKLIDRIEFKLKTKKTLDEKAVRQLKKLVKDYHTHN